MRLDIRVDDSEVEAAIAEMAEQAGGADRLEEMGYDWLHEEPETATVG